jgi:hypothetical protein
MGSPSADGVHPDGALVLAEAPGGGRVSAALSLA